MNDRELARIMEEVVEELDRAKQRILWKLADIRNLKKWETEEGPRPVRSYERSFFSLD